MKYPAKKTSHTLDMVSSVLQGSSQAPVLDPSPIVSSKSAKNMIKWYIRSGVGEDVVKKGHRTYMQRLSIQALGLHTRPLGGISDRL